MGVDIRTEFAACRNQLQLPETNNLTELYLPVSLFPFVVILRIWNALLGRCGAVAGHAEFKDDGVMYHTVDGGRGRHRVLE